MWTSARFAGRVELTDIDPPNGYTISGEGQGGVAGFAKGGAKVSLSDDGPGTLLSYDVKAQVGGKTFATLWDAGHLNAMLDEAGILTAVAAHPAICAEVWWGKRLSAVQVTLDRADTDLVSELLADAWERRAPH